MISTNVILAVVLLSGRQRGAASALLPLLGCFMVPLTIHNTMHATVSAAPVHGSRSLHNASVPHAYSRDSRPMYAYTSQL